MVDIRLSEDLWSTSMAPEGVLERWRLRPAQIAVAGTSVAEVRIDDALHEVLAPASGRLTLLMDPNAVVQPGDVIGRIDAG